MKTMRDGKAAIARLAKDRVWWIIVAAGVAHTLLHYATYVPVARRVFAGLPYFNLHAIHEAEFIAIISLAAYRFRALGGSILLALSTAASVPYVLAPYVFGREPREYEIRDRLTEVAIVLAVGAFVTFLGELHARDRERRARALEHVEASNRRLIALYEAGEALARASSLADASTASARALVRYAGSDACAAVFLYNPDVDSFLLGGREGLPSEAAATMNMIKGGPVLALLAMPPSRTLAVESLPDGLSQVRHALRDRGFATCFLIPLRIPGELLGLTLVFFRETEIAAETLELLKTIGQQASQAVRNAHLYESERHQRELVESFVRNLRLSTEGRGARQANLPS